MPGETIATPGSADPAESIDALAFFHVVLACMPDTTVFGFGTDLRIRYADGSGLEALGWTQDQVLGHRPSELLADQAESAETLEEAMREALAGRPSRHELTGLRNPDFYLESVIRPLTIPSGQIVGGVIVSRNLSPLQRERRRRQRLEFLAEIDRVLAGCRDRREVMKAVVGAAVPRLGDWCSIHVFMDARDREPTVEVGHVDPDKVRLAEEMVALYPYDPDATVGIPQVIRTGTPVLFTGVDRDRLEVTVTVHDRPVTEDQQEGFDTVRQLDLTSSLIVPLSTGGLVTGALSFSVSGGGRLFDEDDLTLAEALAGRVAAALENRRLGEMERRIASTLQRSLLPPELPVLPRADLAVRYWAAGEGTEVGGDFYDVFDTGHGTHAVVIGDVCGSGPAAAAVTASARHTIRALARRGDDHATVLRHLDDAVRSSWPDLFCTVLYATLTPTGSGLHLTAVSGGHPLPIVVRAGAGEAFVLGRPGMLLGTIPIADPEPFEADLEMGDTVVFYTDGAYDLPPPAFLSDAEMLDLVAGAAGAATDAEGVADAIAGQLESQAPFGERDDDVAVVVIRVDRAG